MQPGLSGRAPHLPRVSPGCSCGHGIIPTPLAHVARRPRSQCLAPRPSGALRTAAAPASPSVWRVPSSGVCALAPRSVRLLGGRRGGCADRSITGQVTRDPRTVSRLGRGQASPRKRVIAWPGRGALLGSQLRLRQVRELRPRGEAGAARRVGSCCARVALRESEPEEPGALGHCPGERRPLHLGSARHFSPWRSVLAAAISSVAPA